MESASIHEIKKELQTLSPERMQQICLRLAKYKKENKELLHYLLFEEDDRAGFLKACMKETDEQFKDINRSNVYYAKKNIRKILRGINRYIKYSASPEFTAELLIHFCRNLKHSGIRISQSKVLDNLYENQLKRIEKVLAALHEDIQYDLRKEMEGLQE